MVDWLELAAHCGELKTVWTVNTTRDHLFGTSAVVWQAVVARFSERNK